MQLYMALLLLIGSIVTEASDKGLTASQTKTDYQQLVSKYAVPPARVLTPMSAALSVAGGLLISRAAKLSLPVSAAVTGGCLLAGAAYTTMTDLQAQVNSMRKLAQHQLVLKPNCFAYGAPVKEAAGLLDKEFYSKAVASLPLCCVDIFVYDAKSKKYFMVKRDNEPVKGSWWLPGGRLNKGESFTACAKRKCKEEAGLLIDATELLGVYSTTFDVSAWNCPTHTVNVAVLGYHKPESTPQLDALHNKYCWQPINLVPGSPYLNAIYQNALKKLTP